MRIDAMPASPLASSSSSASTLPDCAVCGYRSTGMHYGAITCEGCKQFFKRWMLKPKNLVCRQGTNECEINVATRNGCQHCRLQKCFSEGMVATRQAPPPEASPSPPLQSYESRVITLEDLLVEPKLEEEEYDETPQIDLSPFEEEVERAKTDLTSSTIGLQKFERLWQKETEEYLAKKTEFEEFEARYMERRDVYLEALGNRKRKLQKAKSTFDFKMQKLNDARKNKKEVKKNDKELRNALKENARLRRERSKSTEVSGLFEARVGFLTTRLERCRKDLADARKVVKCYLRPSTKRSGYERRIKTFDKKMIRKAYEKDDRRGQETILLVNYSLPLAPIPGLRCWISFAKKSFLTSD
ncbi:hypothetical protein QR680_011965 [Steinernema hermaphroditum]|uniref:Nuclear receptor domain-containing protein n=1 Tax=Steinernema hermaphroditum TaxID=289476 RepID=A0AA39I2W1_9BILA|nr:hypothetical protein QR680_011965 [Steinernema hermaphroditum]